jgi:hypothetical protein
MTDRADGVGLADRVRWLQDLKAIRGLLLTFGALLDAKDWAGYADLFAEDGGFVAPIGTVTGREAIRELFNCTLRDVPSAFHVYSEPIIDIDGDQATVRSMWLYVWTGAQGWPEILQFGHYDDILVKRDGCWLFKLRTITRAAGRAPYTR